MVSTEGVGGRKRKKERKEKEEENILIWRLSLKEVSRGW